METCQEILRWISSIKNTRESGSKLLLMIAGITLFQAVRLGDDPMVTRLITMMAVSACFALIFMINPSEKTANYLDVKGILICLAFAQPVCLQILKPVAFSYDVLAGLVLASIVMGLLLRACHELVKLGVWTCQRIYQLGARLTAEYKGHKM